MNVDYFGAIMGLGPVGALATAIVLCRYYLTAEGPVFVRHLLLGSALCGVLAPLCAMYWVCSYIVPETSAVSAMLVDNRNESFWAMIVASIMMLIARHLALHWPEAHGQVLDQ